jgi:hypothetical protein
MIKKCIFLYFLFLFLSSKIFSQNVGIGTTTPHASAALDVQSTSKGLLPPRMTTIQRDAISSPTPGLILFNTDTQSLEVFTNTGWFGIKKTNFAIEKLLGGNDDEIDPIIQNTGDGGYISAVESKSSANGNVTGTNHGSNDYWIVKLNAVGTIVWNKLLGGNGLEKPFSIQQAIDGGYIIAGYSGSSVGGDVTGPIHGSLEFWIVKLDALGNITWNKSLGGTNGDEAYSIQQTTDGGYIVAGYSASSATGNVTGTNHGLGDYWIVKLDALGNIIWNKLLGGSALDVPREIQQTTDGGYIVAGYSASSANGDVTGTNHGLNDCWIVKLDALGNILWNKLLGGNSDERIYSIQQATDGGYILAGYSTSSINGDVTATNHGSNDYWIVKLDASGNILWNKLLGGGSSDFALSIQQTTDGGYIVAGASLSSANGDVSGTTHGNYDFWIVKLDALGNISWNKLLGGSGIDAANSIRQTSNGKYIIAGHSSSSVNGDVTGGNHGINDLWIVKLDAGGNIIYQ